MITLNTLVETVGIIWKHWKHSSKLLLLGHLPDSEMETQLETSSSGMETSRVHSLFATNAATDSLAPIETNCLIESDFVKLRAFWNFLRRTQPNRFEDFAGGGQPILLWDLVLKSQAISLG